MTSDGFLRVVDEAFAPFLQGLGFAKDKTQINGRYYEVSFNCPRHSVSVSFEPGDHAWFVFLFRRENGRLSDPDDPVKTLRLSDLNNRYQDQVTSEERAANDLAFRPIETIDQDQRSLLQAAKDLRLVLPKYLADQGS